MTEQCDLRNTLSIENISKSYSSNKIVSNFSCQFLTGCHALIGENGSGKSTLLKMICGAEIYDGGNILFDGISLKESKIDYKKNIGYAPDKLMIYPFLTGSEFIRMIFSIKGITDKGVFSDILDGFNIRKYLQYRLDEMSLGNQKKFMLAAAFIGDPGLLVLDEPTNEIDIESKNYLISCLLEMKKDKVIIFSTHDDNFISALDAKKYNLSDMWRN
ncbi:MAG: ABC transporter ATP-binding protein [Coxiellaceae bacterium]|nr:ABC transporter ATP-binding protein [Coxiellaceae bacterium]